MYCIKCEGDENKLAKSNIVQNFRRKRLTGDIDSTGAKKFKFRWIGRKDLPNQDLPKPKLMCEACDSELGEKAEKNYWINYKSVASFT